MDITYLCSSTIPSRAANSIHVMKMCQALARNGHTVTLLAPTKTGEYEPGVDDVFEFYGVAPVFELRKLSCPRVRGRSLIYSAAAAWAVRRLRPDLVLGRFVQGCVLTAWMGTPTMFECHQPIWEIGTLQYGCFEVLRRAPELRSLIVVSEALKTVYLDETGLGPDEILVAHDAADDPGTVDDPVLLKGKRENTLQAGYVGNLYEGKGMGVVADVAPRMPEVDFHVVGGLDNDIARWKRRIEAENVTFHGFVDQSQVPRYMAALDVCLLPNQRSVAVYGSGNSDIGRYTSPLKMFEYMSHGKPIVASDLPVLREVLIHGKNAVLCDPEDPDAWVEALRRLSENEAERARLGGQARRDFEAHHTWRVRARRLLQNVPSPSRRNAASETLEG